ncbi:MAG: zf-HC2 domain-containing protein [Pseudomonadota bacterium]
MMPCDTAIALLDDYVDEALTPAERAALQAHLAACPACRAELAALHALLAEAAALPAGIEPPRDLWAGIAAQIQPTAARRPWYARPHVLALAAVLLIGATAAVTHLLEPAPAPRVAEAPVPWEVELEQANAALALALDARRADLDPTTVAILDENLHIIDQAIQDCRIALETDPANPRLEASLRATWEQRIRVLERANRLPSDS